MAALDVTDDRTPEEIEEERRARIAALAAPSRLGPIGDVRPRSPAAAKTVDTEAPRLERAGGDMSDGDLAAASPRLKPLSFADRQRLPVISPGVEAGSSGQYRSEIARDEDQKRNPWGSAENHPGRLGKIGHIAARIGNIAGDIVAPATMSLIKGTDLNKQLEEYGSKQNLEAQEGRDVAVDTEKNRAKHEENVEAARNQVKPKEEEWGVVPGVQGPNGEPVQQEKTSGQVRVAPLEGASLVDKTKSTSAHVSYDQGIPVSVTSKEGQVFDINDPKLPPDLKPLVEAASRAHSQHTKEASDQQARSFAQAAEQQAKSFGNQQKMFEERQNAPTSATKTMIEAAPNVKKLIARLRPLAEAELQGSGPLGARWSDFWNNKVGAPNPRYNMMRVDDGLLATLMMRMHVGQKGGELMMEHFSKLLGLAHQSPENYMAALDELDHYASDVMSESHSDVTKNGVRGAGSQSDFKIPDGAPKAPAQDGHKLKVNGEVVAISKGGQWQNPTP